MKFLLFFALNIQMIFTSSAIASLIPPFPVTEPPYDQAEWEKTLSPPQQNWILQSKKNIELKAAHQKKHLPSFRCMLVLNKRGKFSGSPFFADQQIAEKQQVIKCIRAFRFPSLPKGMDSTTIMLYFDQNAKVSIRFVKAADD